MPNICFFILTYSKEDADKVEYVCEQIEQAVRGERLIVTAPDGIMVEEFEVGRAEDWET